LQHSCENIITRNQCIENQLFEIFWHGKFVHRLLLNLIEKEKKDLRYYLLFLEATNTITPATRIIPPA
jgi:hypothetical protein